MPLHQRLGGDAGIAELVEALSARVSADPVMGPYFREVDVEALNRHRAMFLSAFLGGSESYTGKSISEAHSPFRLSEVEFEAFIRVVRETLDDSTVPPLDRQRVLRRLQRLRRDVVSRAD